MSSFIRKYGTATVAATHVYIPVLKAGSEDFATGSDWTPAAGDVKISKDGGAPANITTLPTYNAATHNDWKFDFSATELQCKQIAIRIVDSATKAVQDQYFTVETYGNAAAMMPVDYSDIVRMGLTALPNAIAGATGGLPTSKDSSGRVSLAATGLDAIVSTATGMVEIAKAIWDRLLTGATHNINNSAGKRLRQLQVVGQYDGAIWLDTIDGVAGIVDYENGTSSNPVDSIEDALTLSASLNIKIINVAPGSSFTPTGNVNGVTIHGEAYDIAFNGKDYSDAHIYGATITGVALAATDNFDLHGCQFGTSVTLPSGTHIHNSGLGGTIVIGDAGEINMDACYSSIAGGSAPIIDFGAALNASSVSCRHYSGGIQVANMGAGTGTYLMSIEGDGKLTIAASCSATSEIHLRGNFNITDNASEAVTLFESANITSLQGKTYAAGSYDRITDSLEAISDNEGSGTVDANLVSIDGALTTGNNATLNLKQLNIQNSTGSAAIIKSTGSNGHGIDVAGNGSGHGIYVQAPGTGNGMEIVATNGNGINAVGDGGSGTGIRAYGGASSGTGFRATSGATGGHGMIIQALSNGNGLYCTAAGTDKHGIQADAGTSGHGIALTGTGDGAGINAKAGPTGNGAEITGGSTSGIGLYVHTTDGHAASFEAMGAFNDGMQIGNSENVVGKGVYIYSGNAGGIGLSINSRGGDYDGIYAIGSGTGAGIHGWGGATGDGMKLRGGGTSGNGLYCDAIGGSGDGIHSEASTDGKGIYALGNGASGNGMYLDAGDSFGTGLRVRGGDTGGSGASFETQGGNNHGIKMDGNGSGDGLHATGGATGNGIYAAKGVTSGAGMFLSGIKDIDAKEIDAIKAVTDNNNGGIIDANVMQINDTATGVPAFQQGCQVITASSAKTGTLLKSSMTTNLTEATNDHYNGLIVKFSTGTLAGQAAIISDYDGSTKTVYFQDDLTEAPTNGDKFVIV